MGRFTCENLVGNLEGFLQARRVPPGPQPKDEDLRLVETWFDGLPQDDLDHPQGHDLSASLLVFAANEKGDIGSDDMSALLQAQRQVMTNKFSLAIKLCGS